MVVSELIKSLQYMQQTHGDLPVSIALSSNGKVDSADDLHICFDQREAEDTPGSEINIRNFPY